MDYSDFPKQKRQVGDNTAMGIVLLLPLILVVLVIHLRPAIGTFTMSLTDFNPLRDSEFVGFENYSHLFSDVGFGAALQYTFAIIITRIGVLLFVPAIVGMLVGIQGKIGRILNRLVLGILAAFISPVALIMLWRGYWGPMWGREPSPLSRDLLELMMPVSPGSAVRSTLLLDAIITMGITVVVGTIIYIAVLRGRETHRSHVMKVGFSVWVVGLLFAVGSALQAFIIPFLLTRGGPARTTSSLFFNNYQEGFMFFRLGLAAAQAVLSMLPVVMGVLIVWLLITIFRIRLITISNSDNHAQSSTLSILSLPMIVLIFLPIIGLLLWGHSLAATNAGFSAAMEIVNWGEMLPNLIIPILTIWLIQIPITYLAGAALGLMRPVNRTVTNILFLILLVMVFLPPETLVFRWFLDARDLQIMNTKIVLAIPWLVSGISLLVFKLFFDGMYDEVQAARENGQTTDMILQKVIMSSLPLMLLMGFVASFMCVQSLLWPLVAVNNTENYTPTVALALIASQYATAIAVIEGAAVSFAAMFLIPFGLAFGLLCGFGLEKFALVGGTGDMEYPISSANHLDDNALDL